MSGERATECRQLGVRGALDGVVSACAVNEA